MLTSWIYTRKAQKLYISAGICWQKLNLVAIFHRYCRSVPILKGHKGNDEYGYSIEGSDIILANGKFG